MLAKWPLYDAPSCSPCTGLSELSMSKTTRRCAVCVIARSTHSAFTRPNPFHVAGWGKHLGLEPLMVLAGGRSGRTTCRPDHTHRRIVGQPFSVVGILVARQTNVHRCLRRPTIGAARYPPRSPADPTHSRPVSPRSIIQFATGQRPSVRGDASAVNLQPYTSVETERGAGVGAFTLGASTIPYASRAKVDDHDQC